MIQAFPLDCPRPRCFVRLAKEHGGRRAVREVATAALLLVFDSPQLNSDVGRCRGSARCLGNELDVSAEAGQHINQRVRAEQVDTASQQVAHTGLGYPQHLGRLRLAQAAATHDFLHMEHQDSADLEVLGLLPGEPEVAEDVAAGGSGLHLHKGGLGESRPEDALLHGAELYKYLNGR